MSTEYVQSNYEELDKVAQRFAKQAEVTAQLVQRLKQQSEALRKSWEGTAADAFTREMGTVLLPGVKRLHQAQVQAQNTIQAISRTMEQAESEAAALFRSTPNGVGSAEAGASINSETDGTGRNGNGSTIATSAPSGTGDSSNAFAAAAMRGMGGGGLANGGATPVMANAQAAQTKAPAITFGTNANQAGVSTHSRGVLNDLLQKSKNSSATITSTARTVQDQARIMYGNIESQGVATQKKLYGPNGDKVIDVYVKGKAEGKSQSEIRALMVAKINALGPTNVSKHLADPAVLNVIDISPNSIKNRAAFEAAVRADPRVSKFLTPSDGDPAYHIEIPQPKPKK